MDTSKGNPTRITRSDGTACSEQFWYEFGREDVAYCEGAGPASEMEYQERQWGLLEKRFAVGLQMRGQVQLDNDSSRRDGGDLMYFNRNGSSMHRELGAGIWLPVPKATQDDPVKALGAEWHCVDLSALAKLFPPSGSHHRTANTVTLAELCGTLLKLKRRDIKGANLSASLGWGVAAVGGNVTAFASAVAGYYKNAQLRSAGYDGFLDDEWDLLRLMNGLPPTKEKNSYVRAVDAGELLKMPVHLFQAIWLPRYLHARRVPTAVVGWGGMCDSSDTSLDELCAHLVTIESHIRTFNQLRRDAALAVAEAQGIAADFATLRVEMSRFSRNMDERQTAAIDALDALIHAADPLLLSNCKGVVTKRLPGLAAALDQTLGELQRAASASELMDLLKKVVPVRYAERVRSSFPEQPPMPLIDWVSALASRYAVELANSAATQGNLETYLTGIKAPAAAADILEFTLGLTHPPEGDKVSSVFLQLGPWRCASVTSMVMMDVASKRFASGDVDSYAATADSVLSSAMKPFEGLFVDAFGDAVSLAPNDEGSLAALTTELADAVKRGKELATKERKELIKTGAETKETFSSALENAGALRDPGRLFTVISVIDEPWPSDKGPLLWLLPASCRTWTDTALLFWAVKSKTAGVKEALKKLRETAHDPVAYAKLLTATADEATSVMKVANRLWRLAGATEVFADRGALFWIGEASFIVGLTVSGVEATRELGQSKDIITQLGDVAIMQGCLFLVCSSTLLGGGSLCVTIGMPLLVVGLVVTKRKTAIEFARDLGPLLQDLNRSKIDVTVLLMAGEKLTPRTEGADAPSEKGGEHAAAVVTAKVKSDPLKSVHADYPGWCDAMGLRSELDRFVRACKATSFSEITRYQQNMAGMTDDMPVGL